MMRGVKEKHMDKTSIVDMCYGAIKERVDYEAAHVVDNIFDPNTKAKAKRKITVTLELMPVDDRQVMCFRNIY